MNHDTILFTTEFSDRDKSAFEASCQLALKSNARLIILHVQDPRFEAQSKANRKEPSVEFSRYIPKDLEINFEHAVMVGDPPEKILAVAESENVDLIVLGTHGRSGLSRAFAGSVAEKVMRNSETPVMTVRESGANQFRNSTPRILVPVDFSVYGYAAVDYSTKLALAIGGELSIVYVDVATNFTAPELPSGQLETSHEKKTLWKQLTKFIPSNDRVAFSHELLTGEPASAINDYANSHHFDFIVIGTHGRSGLRRVIIGSVAESVVRHSNCPVISVKPSNKRSDVLTS
jgi:nucleotide-binding universal stress UspA family protein